LFARLLLTGLNFGTGILVARTLEAHGRGVQAAISIWPLVIGGLFTLGIPSALRFRIPREPDRASQFLSTALIFALILGVGGIVAGLLFVPHWLSKYDASSIRFAQWILLFIPGSLGLLMIGAFFEATGRFRQSNSLIYAPPASTLVALLVLALTHRMTPFTSTLAYYIPTNVVFLVRLWSLRTDLRFPPTHLRKFATLLASYGVKAFGIDVLATLSTQIDQALVVRFLSAPQLGIYAVALAVSRVLNHFANALATVLMPKAAALPPTEALALVSRAARITFGATAIGAVVLSLVTPIAVPFFYGHDFTQAGRLAQILYVEVTLGATITVLAQAFLSTGRPGVVTTLQAVGLGAILPLMLFAIPRYGLLGAALALLGSTALRLAFVLVCFPVLLKVAPPNIFPSVADARFALMRVRGSRSAF
jgi:O-antigen/teichoic acid export membrane protein